MTTKFVHIRDPRDVRRVLTLARKIVETETGSKTLHVGYAINRVDTVSDDWGLLPKPDVFRRKLGNKIAEGRLESNPVIIPLKDEQHPMDAVRSFFQSANHHILTEGRVPFVVKRVVDADREFYELSHSGNQSDRMKAATKFS